VTIDLRSPDAPDALQGDVCIVGAGTAGAYLANRLVNAGLDVVLLEAGGESTADGRELGFDPVATGTPYGGVHEGRAFGVGGTSAKWGGLLIPYGDLDVEGADAAVAPVWRHVVKVVSESTGEVRQVLGLDSPADHETRGRTFLGALDQEMAQAGMVSRVSEMLPFKSRNLARLLRSPDAKGLLRTIVHAVAGSWTPSPGGSPPRVESVTAISESGRKVSCRARHFVVACGALESARVLLEIDRATGRRVLLGRESIGRGLSDHLSARVASVFPEDVPLAARLFAPRFDGSVMRAVRWSRPGLRPRHFAHLAFAIENPGFLLARKALFALQARKAPRFSPGELARGTGGLAALAWSRLVRHRLHVPPGTPVALQLDVEQESSDANSVQLGIGSDRFQRPPAVVHWSVSPKDLANLGAAQKAFLDAWATLGNGVPRLQKVGLDGPEAKLHDAYHPVGTTRMGDDPAAVVDRSLRVRGTANLHALSTGVFPRAGGANPTFGLLCLAQSLSTLLRGDSR
jgi:hypothetical protein